MKSTDVGLLDRLPARIEIGHEIVLLDKRRRWLRSLYRLRCRIDEQANAQITSSVTHSVAIANAQKMAMAEGTDMKSAIDARRHGGCAHA